MDPSLAWRTPLTRLGAVWDPGDAGLHLAGRGGPPPFAEGQVYLLELMVAGVLRIPAAFAVTRVDPEARIIEFVYLERNVSNGMQRISLRPSLPGEGGRAGRGGAALSVVEHVTWYRSGKPFRDAVLYPPFHVAILDAFHRAALGRAGLALRKTGP